MFMANIFSSESSEDGVVCKEFNRKLSLNGSCHEFASEAVAIAIGVSASEELLKFQSATVSPSVAQGEAASLYGSARLLRWPSPSDVGRNGDVRPQARKAKLPTDTSLKKDSDSPKQLSPNTSASGSSRSASPQGAASAPGSPLLNKPE